MRPFRNNRFQDFFVEGRYVSLKNYLYNYRLRKRAVENSLRKEKWNLILELGSGISPVMTKTDKIIYSDLSFDAITLLRKSHHRGHHLVADAMNLPFKTGVLSHVVCSEVLEHLEDDGRALQEISRVIKSFGKIILTFPHRKAFFANDDRYVNHYRRYETPEVIAKLKRVGFIAFKTEKVLGPLEKITMSVLIFCLSAFEANNRGKKGKHGGAPKIYAVLIFAWLNLFYMGLAWLDARLMPASLSAVRLIKAQKGPTLKSAKNYLL